MLRLQLFGGLSLVADAGPPPSPAMQRRRLALLARLAASPDGSVSRDKLVACFWPDEDRERARHYLADSVFTLRRSLGKEVLLSVGDDLLLSDDAWSCDVREFRTALERGDAEGAVELYRGPFLDGFFVGDAADFERWVEEERGRLARLYGEALERLAGESEGRGAHERAVHWWRRLAAHDPFSSRIALRLMQALAAGGDRAAAVQHARIHAALLREELEVEPDATVQALAAELATAPTPRLESRSPGTGTSAAPAAPAAPAADRGAPRASAADPHEATLLASSHAPGATTSEEPTARDPHEEPATAAALPAREESALPRSRLHYLRRQALALAPLLVLLVIAAMAVWESGRRAWRDPVPITDGAETITIAVMPFDYQGRPDDAYLGNGLVTLLGTSLNQAGRLRAADSHSILSRTADAAAGTRLSLRRAGEIASEVGADVFFLGTMIESGGRFQIMGTLYEAAATPVEVQLVTAQGTDEFALVDDFVRQLLAGAFIDAEDRLTQLAVLTTDSLPALKAYLRGEHEFRAARYPAAVEALRAAVSADPEFALAQYRLSVAEEWSFGFIEARRAAAEARRLSEHLPTRHRRLIAAWHAFVNGDAAEAERAYDAILVDHPGDVEAWSGLGEVRAHFNHLRGRPPAEAKYAFQQVLSLAPNYGEARFHLLEFAAREGAVALFDSLLSGVDPRSPQLLSWQVARWLAWESPELPDSLNVKLERAQEVIVGVAAVRAAIHFRDLEAAQALASRLVRPGRPEGWRAAGHVMAAQGHFARGDRAAGYAALDSATTIEPGWALELRSLAALLPESEVQEAEVRALRAELERWNPRAFNPETTFFFATHADAHAQLRLYLLALLSLQLRDEAAVQKWEEALRATGGSATTGATGRGLALSVAAHRAVSKGERDEALKLLEAARLDAPLERIALSPFFAQGLDRYLRAELLSAEGNPREALRWYRSLTDGPDLLWWGAAHRRQSELLTDRGRAGEARWHRERWEELWRAQGREAADGGAPD